MFSDRLTAVVFVLALGLFFVVLELVRQRRLAEQYSLLWLGASVLIVLLSLSRPLLDQLAFLVGVAYPPSALFGAGFVAGIVLVLYFSLVVTKLSRQNREAAQRIGLLKWQLEQMQRRLDALEQPTRESIEGD